MELSSKRPREGPGLLSSWLLMKVPEVAGVCFATCLTTFPACRHLKDMGQMESGGKHSRFHRGTISLLSLPVTPEYLPFRLLLAQVPPSWRTHTCLPSRLTDGYSMPVLSRTWESKDKGPVGQGAA